MKCALEMNVVVLDAKEEARLKELAKKERIARFNKQAKVNAVRFCEEILAPMLEEKAKKCGRYISLTLDDGNNYWNEYSGCASLLEERKRAYADGRSSFTPTGYTFHLPTVIEYLTQHCYAASYRKTYYMRYNSGAQKAYLLEVCIPENPCEK